MNTSTMLSLGAALWAAIGAFSFAPSSPNSNQIQVGEEAPAYQMTTIDGATIDSRRQRGKTVVLIYLSAEQRNSERAALDAERIVKKLENDKVELLFVTADVIYKAYWEKLWKETELSAPLAFDGQRKLYGELGLIVFPTTLVIDEKGLLSHVISTRGTDYSHVLEAYIKHTLGLLSDEDLKKQLTAKSFDRGSPKSLAARHRAAARLLREKGLLEGAEGELRSALELDSTNTHIRLDLADLCIALDRMDESGKILDAILEAEPQHRRARSLKGIVLFKIGENDKAKEILEAALELNPDPARTHFYLGRIDEEAGDKDGAIGHYRAALVRLLKE